jgi:cytochrome c551/c552
MAKIADFLTMEMIVSKTMRRVVPGLVLAAVVCASTIVSKAEAAGDAAAGEHVFARCIVCHSPKAGENKIGPSLAGVFGRRATTIHPPSNQLASHGTSRSSTNISPIPLLMYMEPRWSSAFPMLRIAKMSSPT